MTRLHTASTRAPARPTAELPPLYPPDPEPPVAETVGAARRSPLQWWQRRTGSLPPWLVVSQLFFGLGWLRAAAEKVVTAEWWTGEYLVDFVASHSTQTLAWIQPLLMVAVPLAPLTAAVVLAAQLAIGAALLFNRHAPGALMAAMALNLVFVAVGAVNPSAFYLAGQGAMLLWALGRSRPSPRLSNLMRLGTAAAVALAVVNVPLISTLHPAAVIDDPAMMMITVGSLAAIALECTHRAVFGRTLP